MSDGTWNDGCAFCAIVAGDEPAEIVCEGADWLAMFPISPATRGHTMVVPRVHVADLWQTDPALAQELMAACISVGEAIRTLLAPDGMNLISSAGEAAEQSVFHLHLHVVPRWDGDRIGRIWPTSTDETPEWTSEVADALREACRST